MVHQILVQHVPSPCLSRNFQLLINFILFYMGIKRESLLYHASAETDHFSFKKKGFLATLRHYKL